MVKDISIIVLCYHSGESILPYFSSLNTLLEEMEIDYEIVLVANDFADSKDKTIEIVKRMAEGRPRVKTVTKIKEGMMGWDMIQGMNAATGEIICVIDGDGQFPLDSIRTAYEIMKVNPVDMVKTYRYRREDGVYRKFVSMVYNFIFRLMFPGLKSKDVNSKPKLIRKDALERMQLHSTDWFIDAEMMIRVKQLGMQYIEFPIVFKSNDHRPSLVKAGAIWEFIINLFRYRFSQRR
ncbi:MAG TPA: glycosyltransferase family 2 protein [Saprospiraceae bacterium]|nr:glycosyltransferase family 2 protein [Saprospiraceae bacterium]